MVELGQLVFALHPLPVDLFLDALIFLIINDLEPVFFLFTLVDETHQGLGINHLTFSLLFFLLLVGGSLLASLRLVG